MFTLPNDYTAAASISRQHQGVKSTLETPLHSPEPVRNLSFGYGGLEIDYQNEDCHTE